MTLALVTGSLAPYSNRLYEAYAEKYNEDVHVLQCATVEPGRKWKVPQPKYLSVETMAGVRINKSDISHIYVNPGVLRRLARINPETIVIDCFSPTMIAAGLYASAAGKSLGMLIEGARDLDPGEYSRVHAYARRLIAARSTFGICTSFAARDMMEHWGLAPGRGVIVRHFGSWDPLRTLRGFDERPFDLLLCGTLNERKNPIFVADVADRLLAHGFRPKIRIVGNGPLKDKLAARLSAAGIVAQFDGHLQPDAIVEAYQSAKLLLFPTHADTWGLVANEAMLCGTPVLASPHAVSSRELVQPYGIGKVRPLDAADWAECVRSMLASKDAWQEFLIGRDKAIREFNIDKSVSSLATAIDTGRLALGREPSHA